MLDNRKSGMSVLMECLLGKNVICNNKAEIFVDAFSSFICASDDAYKYNYPFLIEQFKNFSTFEKQAREKVNILLKINESLKSSSVIMSHACKDNIEISLNDFLTLNSLKGISLCDNFSSEGAKSKENVLTIRFYINDRQYLRILRLAQVDIPDKVSNIIENLLIHEG